ncbi:MAG: cytochrome c3 family protein [Polyangiales bacterium]
MPWAVHKLPDHAYFDHSVHLNAGVGCVSCHGRIDQMEVVELAKPVSMGWCLECHRNPEPNLRPKNQITNMKWERKPGDEALIAKVEDLAPPEHCSGCHR